MCLHENETIMLLPEDDLHSRFQDCIDQLHILSKIPESDMIPRDWAFRTDLIRQFNSFISLSPRQWEWVKRLSDRYTEAEPLYGSFDPILVMFRLSQEHGLKRSRIRLVTEKDRFVQLTFEPSRNKDVQIHVDGWQGHGYRKFAGVIHADRIIPYSSDRCGTDVKNVIQSLALDPKGVSKAMANKLGICIYCASRLTDPISKEVGYGPICAQHYELPWGDKTNKRINLDALFT